MKKILAFAIVAVMAFACVFSVSAEEWTLPDLDCTNWWTHNPANVVEIKEGTTVVTYTCTVNANIADTELYRVPSVLLFTGDEPVQAGAGYKEIWLNIGDNRGWTIAAGYYGVDADIANVDGLASVGITQTTTFEEGHNWDTMIPELKQGATVTVSFERTGDLLTMVFNNGAKIVSTVNLPIAATDPVYLSPTGDGCQLTNFVVNYTASATEDPAPTGDLIVLPIALMCISAGAVLTLKKK